MHPSPDKKFRDLARHSPTDPNLTLMFKDHVEYCAVCETAHEDLCTSLCKRAAISKGKPRSTPPAERRRLGSLPDQRVRCEGGRPTDLPSCTRSHPAPRPFIEEPPPRSRERGVRGSDVTRPLPIGASVYVGTSDSSGLGLRSLAEVAEAGTPPGGSAGGPSVAAAPPAPPASPLGPRL